MNNVCPNPGCGAVYQISTQHVGKRLACKKCAAPLVVTDYGLQLEGGAAPAAMPGEFPTAGDGAPLVTTSRRGPGAWTKFRAWMSAVADPPTWLFGAGAFLVIVYLFFPLIDQANVRSREALIIAGDVRQTRLDMELEKKKEKASDDDREKRKKDKEAWEKQKNTLEEAVEAAEIGQRRAIWWYRWGTLLGFLLLAFGSLGYLKPNQPLIRRILGCVVLSAILLSVLSHASGLGVILGVGGR
jgi:hypothetical protein